MYRIGQSTDIHQLVEGRDLILGGVKIDHPLGLKGHSDADVLLHAISEAILGALALNDLGCLFPDNDDRYLNISSMVILNKVYEIMDSKGYKINNIDSLISFGVFMLLFIVLMIPSLFFYNKKKENTMDLEIKA